MCKDYLKGLSKDIFLFNFASLKKVNIPAETIKNKPIKPNSYKPKNPNAHAPSLIVDLKNEILENSPKAINMGIKAFNYLSNQNKNQKYLQKMLKELTKTNDAKEGIKAFIEKRKPNWGDN